jgi:hypothetical protein
MMPGIAEEYVLLQKIPFEECANDLHQAMAMMLRSTTPAERIEPMDMLAVVTYTDGKHARHRTSGICLHFTKARELPADISMFYSPMAHPYGIVFTTI